MPYSLKVLQQTDLAYVLIGLWIAQGLCFMVGGLTSLLLQHCSSSPSIQISSPLLINTPLLEIFHSINVTGLEPWTPR